MTFDEIVDDVMSRLNLSSLEARTRVEGFVNQRYKRVTSSIGLQTSRRVETTVTCDPTDPNSELPKVVVTGLEKIIKIKMTDATTGGVIVLKEKTYDEITNSATLTRNPRTWAVVTMGPSEVTIILDSYPSTSFDLEIQGYETAMELQGSQEPFMPEDFHDLLVYGTLADELRKMEKYDKAKEHEAIFEMRLSDLRMFISKSILLDIAQGKDKPGQLWYRPWWSRVSIWN